MNDLSELQCLDNAQNTGTDACAFDPKMLVQIILTPKKYQVARAVLQTGDAGVLTALQDDCNNDSKSLRLYPINGIENITDSSEALVVQTLGYGAKHVVRDGMQDWTLQFVNGGLSLLKKLRSFVGATHDFFLVDSNNVVIGTKGTDATGADCLQAISLDSGFFYAQPWKASDGSKVSEYAVRLSFAPKYINDFVEFYAFGAGYDLPSLLVGLETVVLTSPGANATSGSYNVIGLTQDSKTNILSLYPTQLLVANLWKATNDAGLVIAISGITTNPNLGGAGIAGFVVALTKTDPNYPTSGDVHLTFVGPTELTAADIEGIESTSVSIAKN